VRRLSSSLASQLAGKAAATARLLRLRITTPPPAALRRDKPADASGEIKPILFMSQGAQFNIRGAGLFPVPRRQLSWWPMTEGRDSPSLRGEGLLPKAEACAQTVLLAGA